MTAPVTQIAVPVKLDMTAPVTQTAWPAGNDAEHLSKLQLLALVTLVVVLVRRQAAVKSA